MSINAGPEGFCLDDIIDRRNTNSIKWDECDEQLLPMWVADMDFRVPPPVLERMRRALDHGIFGYTCVPEEVWESVAAWTASRYNWPVETKWMSYTSGVITGLNVAIQTFTRPGERIVIQPPVYPPFHNSVRSNGRELLFNPLAMDGRGDYRFDLEQLRSCITEDTRMLVLCNPHNPVGRAWTRSELEGVAEIALERNILVFSDEIHADLLLEEPRHVPFASLGPDVAARTITGLAPSKTFNIAGLKASVIVTSDEELRTAFDEAQARTFGLYHANTFAVAGMHAAYAEGGPWLDSVLAYLRGNRDEALRFLSEEIPSIRGPSPAATFLLWLDFSATGLPHEEVSRVLRQEAQLLLNDGRSFGPGGENHFRLNFGCPRATLMEGLERLARAFASGGA
ncbi:MAG: putative C-S lyase [Spirochaetaceae bacterium]|nr:MAG: putative C-S lyase [Spirochaetaceae bacterium]